MFSLTSSSLIILTPSIEDSLLSSGNIEVLSVFLKIFVSLISESNLFEDLENPKFW